MRTFALALAISTSLFGAVAVALVVASGHGPRLLPAAAPRAARVPRDAFRAAVIGKSPAEVVAILGRPEKVYNLTGTVSYVYADRTYEPVAKYADTTAFVEFTSGVCTGVFFQ
jgi:hypothetical protein